MADELLTQLTRAAVRLHALTVQLGPNVARNTAAFEKELENLSAQFDQLHEEALLYGVPIERKIELNLDGVIYRLLLTEDGLEYQPFS